MVGDAPAPLQRLMVRGEYVYAPNLRTDYRTRIAWARRLGDTERLELIEWLIGTPEYELLYDEGIQHDRLR